MKTTKRVITACLGFLILQTTAMIDAHPSLAAGGKEPSPQELRIVPNEIYKLKMSNHTKFFSLLSENKYDELEKLFLQQNNDSVRLPNGKLKFDYWLAAMLISDSAYQLKPTEPQYASMITMLTNWANARPKSVFSRLALAFTYIDYGWYARGGGYSNTVSDDGWKLFQQREQIASKLLDEAKKLQPELLSSFILRLKIEKDTGDNKANYNKLFDEALAKYPKARTLFFEKELQLQPRWGGDQGEWERFIKTNADAVGGIEGDKLYAQQVWAVDRTHWYFKENLFRTFQLDYPRIKRGCVALQASYPGSYLLLSEYCHLASLSGDKETAKKLFALLAGRFDQEAWWDDTSFESWRKYAES